MKHGLLLFWFVCVNSSKTVGPTNIKLDTIDHNSGVVVLMGRRRHDDITSYVSDKDINMRTCALTPSKLLGVQTSNLIQLIRPLR